MNEDVALILEALPPRLRDETRDYATWVEEHASSIIASLGEQVATRVSRQEFVTLAVCKRILDYPRNQLRTIKVALGHSQARGAESIKIRGENLAPRSPAVVSLEKLQERLSRELGDANAAFIKETRGLKSLANSMARRRYGQ